jgi:hypothetical protein
MDVLPPAPPVVAAPMAASVSHPRGSGFVNALAYLVAVALAAIAAYFSISGMIVLFPGAPAAIVTMGVVMETAKLVTVAFLAHQWRGLSILSRLVLVILVTGLAAINAAGVYSQLVAAHFGDRATATSAIETEAATLAAKTEVQEQKAAPIMYVAQMMGATTEQAIRLLILLMVLTCDPLAVALTAAASRPKWRGPE